MEGKAVASIIMAAGRGSRMKGFEGNKTLLPLVPAGTVFRGDRPILLHIVQSLPPGPKAVVVNHKKEEVMEATRSLGLSYCEQPALNGTGGALLAAGEFIQNVDCDDLIITMGDVPLVQKKTYFRLVESLQSQPLTVLGFRPADKSQYGVLDMDGTRVKRIVGVEILERLPQRPAGADGDLQHWAMLQEGIYVIGFSYPVVPKGLARIRVQISAAHEPEHIDRAIAAFTKVGRAMGVIA